MYTVLEKGLEVARYRKLSSAEETMGKLAEQQGALLNGMPHYIITHKGEVVGDSVKPLDEKVEIKLARTHRIFDVRAALGRGITRKGVVQCPISNHVTFNGVNLKHMDFEELRELSNQMASRITNPNPVSKGAK